MSELVLKVLVADDEPLARRGLCRSVAGLEGFEVVRECANGLEVVAAIREDPPDVCLLDIEMPELDGFGVVEEVGAQAMPAVIFVTAFDRYALRAFEAHALDYVTKPVDDERLRHALVRARALRANAEAATRLGSLMDELSGRTSTPERLVVRGGGRIQLVPVGDIDRAQAADNYVRLFVGAQEILMREPLGKLEARLEPAGFLRVHRSHLVNLERVREVRAAMRGDAEIVLADGTCLPVSRNFRERLDRALGE